MEREKFNSNSGRKPRKSQREKNMTFAQNHYVIKVSFKKTLADNSNSGKSEYDILVRNASKYSKILSHFIKDCALEPKIKVIEKHPLINEKLFSEIHKIGVNINQIAYKVNAKLDEKEFPVFENALAELKQKLNEILEIIRSK
jgi:hypothetical protein